MRYIDRCSTDILPQTLKAATSEARRKGDRGSILTTEYNLRVTLLSDCSWSGVWTGKEEIVVSFSFALPLNSLFTSSPKVSFPIQLFLSLSFLFFPFSSLRQDVPLTFSLHHGEYFSSSKATIPSKQYSWKGKSKVYSTISHTTVCHFFRPFIFHISHIRWMEAM